MGWFRVGSGLVCGGFRGVGLVGVWVDLGSGLGLKGGLV